MLKSGLAGRDSSDTSAPQTYSRWLIPDRLHDTHVTPWGLDSLRPLAIDLTLGERAQCEWKRSPPCLWHSQR